MFYDDLTPGGQDAARAVFLGQPVPNICPTCKGVGAIFRMPANGAYHPLHTKISDIYISCLTCAKDRRIAWLTTNSGLVGSELNTKMHHFKLIPFQATEDLTTEQAHLLTAQRQRAKTLIEQAVQERCGLYTFFGDFGSGKSLALQIIVNEMRTLHQQEGYYASFAGIIDHLRSLFRQGAEASSYWNRLLRIPVLSVDEVTRFNDEKQWIQERLFLLADTRYRLKASHLTVFATNANPHQALPPDEPIGYLFSRLREGRLCELRGDVRSAIAAT